MQPAGHTTCRCYVIDEGPPRLITPPLDGSGCPDHGARMNPTLPEALAMLEGLDPEGAAEVRAAMAADVTPLLDDLKRTIDVIDLGERSLYDALLDPPPVLREYLERREIEPPC